MEATSWIGKDGSVMSRWDSTMVEGHGGQSDNRESPEMGRRWG